MAKIQKKQKNQIRKQRRCLHHLYNNGVIQSLIIHSAALLFLSLIISVPHEHTPVKLILALENVEASIDIEPLTEIRISQEDRAAEETVIDIEPVSTEVDIELKYFENIQTSFAAIDSTSLEDLSREMKADDVSDEAHEPAAKIGRTKETQPIVNARNVSSGENEVPGDATGNGGDNAEVRSIQQRLKDAGAQTGDVQVSIGWNSIDDIDLHVEYVASTGGGGVINWMNRVDFIGGCLDVDRNADLFQATNRPVENIFWPQGSSPRGRFVVGIHNFRNWSGQASVVVTIVVVVDGKKQVFNEICVAGQPLKEVTRFVRNIPMR
jgi:hypothetical protein